jgi:hypothetical protein
LVDCLSLFWGVLAGATEFVGVGGCGWLLVMVDDEMVEMEVEVIGGGNSSHGVSGSYVV